MWSLTHFSHCMDETKAEKLPALSQTVIAPERTDPEAPILELDELWSCGLVNSICENLKGEVKQATQIELARAMMHSLALQEEKTEKWRLLRLYSCIASSKIIYCSLILV